MKNAKDDLDKKNAEYQKLLDDATNKERANQTTALRSKVTDAKGNLKDAVEAQKKKNG